MQTLSPHLFSRRHAVREEQARHMALLIRLLEAAARRARIGPDDHERFYRLPEYELCMGGAYALGFVCRDIPPDDVLLHLIEARPELLNDLPLSELRRYLHLLMRAERWNSPGASLILAALKAGALQLLAQRLESDVRLRPS
ncbi:MAG TPA: hypothetical protein VNS22_25845 [Geminicoccus sp.]|uniref:hypothetical protein n=1 Tax=Geminicoccus sp. TaxID=2024832 RepID=UPI002B6A1A30|nr:hypothetical protein [Geminicoccus sp.]HWL71781.1 hypothetical protein [Geminicoccus sp.]